MNFENMTMNYLTTTHSRRTTNVYSAHSMLPSNNKNNNKNTDKTDDDTALKDVDMNVMRCNDDTEDMDEDQDIDMEVNKTIVNKGNVKKSHSILGRRTFSNAFKPNNGRRCKNQQFVHHGFYSTNNYQIQQPLYKKQRI